MTQHQYAKTVVAQEENTGSAWHDGQVFAVMMAQKLAEKAAVHELAHLTVQHWMHNCHRHRHAQKSRHLQTDVTARVQTRKETET